MRTFILRHDDRLSHEYAKVAANSCDAYDMSWEYFDGFSGIRGSDALLSLDIDVAKETKASFDSTKNKGQLCTASHVAIWKKIIDENIEEAVILEHDAIMINHFKMMLPRNSITALGYRIDRPDRYKKPNQMTSCATKIDGINGSHAYALDIHAAKNLYDGVKQRRTAGCIDSHIMQSPRFRNGVGFFIADPIVALCWLRTSTIRGTSATDNRGIIKSYRENLLP